MRQTLNRLGMTVATATAVAVVLPLAPAQAAYVGGYNKTATTVAKKIHCKNPRLHDGGGQTKTSLVCDLRGTRINVITFKNERQETSWLDRVDDAFPDGGFVGVGRGVVIVAYNGNRTAASKGAAAVNGAVVRVGY
jgi:hypothetical protein